MAPVCFKRVFIFLFNAWSVSRATHEMQRVRRRSVTSCRQSISLTYTNITCIYDWICSGSCWRNFWWIIFVSWTIDNIVIEKGCVCICYFCFMYNIYIYICFKLILFEKLYDSLFKLKIHYIFLIVRISTMHNWIIF